MKLKKIASLALAGVMAVSMLAGCEGGKGNNNNNPDNGQPVITTTPVVDAVNKGQKSTNAVKINFTKNDSLDAALAKAVSVYGSDVNASQIFNAIDVTTSLDAVSAAQKVIEAGKDNLVGGYLMVKGERTKASFYGDDVRYYYMVSDAVDYDIDGDVYTVIGVEKFDAYSEEAALNRIAEWADAEIAQLDAHSALYADDDANGYGDDEELTSGKKYYGYSYDGNISMVSVKQPDGTTDYWVAYVVNQTVATKTLG